MATSLGSLRSSTSSPSSSSTIHGFCIYTHFYYEAIEPGKTKITWDFQTGYDNYGSYPATSSYASARITIKLTATKGVISEVIGNVFPSTTKIYYKNKVILQSGSCIITHDSDGAAGFDVSADVSIGGWDADASKSFAVPTNVPYTACGAPTTVSASGIVRPNDSFTISWSGATNGVSNIIKGYQVYWYATANGTAPSTSAYTETKEVEVTNGSTTGSYTVTLSGATRGYKIVCGVKTLSSISSDYDSGIKTGGSVTINSLPAAPSVSVNKTIVPSSNGQVTFTVTAGSDSDTSQTKTLYYSTSNSTSVATKITSPWSPTVSATTTYYFWTYDGLEFSTSSTSKTITKNSKPTLGVSVTGTNLSSVNNKTSYDYIISPNIAVSSSNGQSSKTYNYYIDYGASTSLGSRKEISSSDSSTSKAIADIRTYGLGHESSGVYYKITAKCNDGIENSDEASSGIFYITKTPSLIGIYNKSDFTNVEGFYSGTKATHFSKILGFRFDRDSGYNTLRISGYPNSTTQTDISLTTDNLYTQGEFTNSNNLSASQVYSIGLEIGHSSGFFSSKSSHSLTKIATVGLSNFRFALAGANFKFFTDINKTYSSSLGHNFGVTPTASPTDLKNFGIISSGYFYIKLSTNGVNTSIITPSINSSTDSTTLIFDIQSNQLISSIAQVFSISQRNSIYPATAIFTIKNAFNEEVSIQQDFKIDFKEDPSLISFSIYPSEYPTYPINLWNYIKEGMNLVGDFEVKSYNTGVRAQVEIKRGEEPWQKITEFSLSKSGGEASSGAPSSYTISKTAIQNIGELIKGAYQVSYRIILTTDAETSITSNIYEQIQVRGHIAPIFGIISSEYNNSILKVKYNFLDRGLSTSGTKPAIKDSQIKLFIKDENVSYSALIDTSNYFNDGDKIVNFTNFDFQSKDSIMAILSATTSLKTRTVDGQIEAFETLKTSNTNINTAQYVAIYNVTPTVAYRKNYLGINTLTPESQEKAIILIGETAGRDTIYFQSANNNLCKVVNFLFDGGSW